MANVPVSGLHINSLERREKRTCQKVRLLGWAAALVLFGEIAEEAVRMRALYPELGGIRWGNRGPQRGSATNGLSQVLGELGWALEGFRAGPAPPFPTATGDLRGLLGQLLQVRYPQFSF